MGKNSPESTIQSQRSTRLSAFLYRHPSLQHLSLSHKVQSGIQNQTFPTSPQSGVFHLQLLGPGPSQYKSKSISDWSILCVHHSEQETSCWVNIFHNRIIWLTLICGVRLFRFGHHIPKSSMIYAFQHENSCHKRPCSYVSCHASNQGTA